MKTKQILDQVAEKYPQKTGIVFKDKDISFSQIRENVFKLANALKAQGVQKGDRVGIYLPNCCEYAYSYLAVFCLGATGVPLDFMLKDDEIISCLDHSETKYLICMPKEGLDLNALKSKIGSLEKVIVVHAQVPDTISYDQIVSQASADLVEASVADGDLALIMYTSGTTGRPKGVMLNYKHLEGSPAAMHHFVDLSDKDVKVCSLPLSHIAGFIYVQNCILFGITLVLMERFNPIEFLKIIQQYRVTCFHIVPAMYMAFLTLKNISQFDLSSIRWMVVFGAPSSPEMMRLFHQHCPNARLLNGWGMTETCPPNTVTPMDSDKIDSVGKPSPHCTIKLFDEDGQEVGQGQVGEIVIKGWVVMDGYYKDEELTQSLIRNGWFYTGDLGRFDEQGFLYIVGRKKEMIKVAGQIVFSPEVEACLYKHEAVAEAAVIGVADTKLRGEAVKVFVSLKPESQATSEDIRAFAREHLASFKVPQQVVIIESLPKNRVGKIDKEQLKSRE